MNFLSIDLDNEYCLDDVDTLLLSVRAQNALRNLGVKTIGELIKHHTISILRVPNCGRKTLNEIRYALAEIGLTLDGERHELEQIKTEMERAP